MSDKYKVVPSLFTPASRIATAKTYPTLTEAFTNMGTGIVLAPDGHIAAFHETQYRFVERHLTH